MHTHTSVYRNGTSYTDTWHSENAQGGLTETEYNNLKNKMLKSVYQNGGFYVGKYETGTETKRTSSSDALTTAVIKQNMYPYNWVMCSQAQTLASGMESGEYTTSLMFGVQWDLVMKYLENNGVSESLLNDDSTNWGNYVNSEYSITNASAKYATIDFDTEVLNEYLPAPYSKASGEKALLTTGASESFGKMGIYDLAGNVTEYTLEYTSMSYCPCSTRGGDFKYGDKTGAKRTVCYSNFFAEDVGLRIVLF